MRDEHNARGHFFRSKTKVFSLFFGIPIHLCFRYTVMPKHTCINSPLFVGAIKHHSFLKVSTKFPVAARRDWLLTANKAINSTIKQGITNIQGFKEMEKAKFSNH